MNNKKIIVLVISLLVILGSIFWLVYNYFSKSKETNQEVFTGNISQISSAVEDDLDIKFNYVNAQLSFVQDKLENIDNEPTFSNELSDI